MSLSSLILVPGISNNHIVSVSSRVSSTYVWATLILARYKNMPVVSMLPDIKIARDMSTPMPLLIFTLLFN